jgi:hypothetical protein
MEDIDAVGLHVAVGDPLGLVDGMGCAVDHEGKYDTEEDGVAVWLGLRDILL